MEAGEASLGGASPANVHGGVIPDLGVHVEATKRVDDWGSIACLPLSPGNGADERERVESETMPPLLSA